MKSKFAENIAASFEECNQLREKVERLEATIAHQAQMIEHLRGGLTTGFTAVDMGTAAADGFRDGVASVAMFRPRKDLVVKVWNAGDDDDAFICAVNGEVSIDGLVGIEEELTGDHEFSSGPGEYTYAATYDDGQYDDMGRCELRPGWELTEIGFEKPDWMSISHEPDKHQEIPGVKCPTCGIVDCHKDGLNGCIPF